MEVAMELLVLGVILAVLNSSFAAVGKGLQKKGVAQLPKLSCTTSVLRQYFTNRRWVWGVVLEIGAGLCGLGALTFLPISMAQPIFCNGLVLLAIYNRFCLKEDLAPLEWASIGLCFVGIVLLAVTLTPRDYSQTSVVEQQLKLFCALVLCISLVLAIEVYMRATLKAIEKAAAVEKSGGGAVCAASSATNITGTTRIITVCADSSVPSRATANNRTRTIEILVGLQAGLCIGAGNASLASGLQSLTTSSWTDQMAHELNGSAWKAHEPHEPLHQSLNGTLVNMSGGGHPWPDDVPFPEGVHMHLAFAVLFAVVGAIVNAVHPVFTNRGYKHGRVMIITTSLMFVAMTTGVVIGIGVLDEPWPAEPGFSAIRSLAFGLMFLGVCAMAAGSRAQKDAQKRSQGPASISAAPSPASPSGAPHKV